VSKIYTYILIKLRNIDIIFLKERNIDICLEIVKTIL